MDFAGYFTGIGPMGAALHGNLDTIGFSEAHGLAAGFALLMILRRNDGWRGWNLVAGARPRSARHLQHHLLAVFASAGVVPVGIIATAIHVIFAALELWAYLQPSARCWSQGMRSAAGCSSAR